MQLDEPVLLAPGVVGDLVARLTDGGLGELLLEVDGRRVGAARSSRAVGRTRRWPDQDDVLGRCVGRERVAVPVVPPHDDLAGFLRG